ncbi:MAG: hypothetical protein ACO1O6_04160 [Bacteroidota bacterium]
MLFWKRHEAGESSDGTKLDNNRIWTIIQILTFAGVGMLALVSAQRYGLEFVKGKPHFDWSNPTEYFVALGTGLLMGGACFCMGALAGFLFGIPKIVESSTHKDPIKSRGGEVLHNDNLVQISDWLTKIIVGVGLTQINQIPVYLDKLGKYFGPSFERLGNPHSAQISETIAICVVLYFLIMGFIACYLWTRFYFAEMLKDSLEDDDEETKKVNVNIVEGNVEGNLNINEEKKEK